MAKKKIRVTRVTTIVETQTVPLGEWMMMTANERDSILPQPAGEVLKNVQSWSRSVDCP